MERSENTIKNSMFFVSDDEQNALVVQVLFERYGFNVCWITSSAISSHLPKLERALIIYDVPSVGAMAQANRYGPYFERVLDLPRSSLLVGLGKAHDVPTVFGGLWSRTVTFLSKPFNVIDAIRMLDLLVSDANDTAT